MNKDLFYKTLIRRASYFKTTDIKRTSFKERNLETLLSFIMPGVYNLFQRSYKGEEQWRKLKEKRMKKEIV